MKKKIVSKKADKTKELEKKFKTFLKVPMEIAEIVQTQQNTLYKIRNTVTGNNFIFNTQLFEELSSIHKDLQPQVEAEKEEAVQNPELVQLKVGSIMNSISFEKKSRKKGKKLVAQYTNSSPDRKCIELERNTKQYPQANCSYKVEIVEDTEPKHADRGKFIVKIIS